MVLEIHLYFYLSLAKSHPHQTDQNIQRKKSFMSSDSMPVGCAIVVGAHWL